MEREINLLLEPAFLSQINFKGDTQSGPHPPTGQFPSVILSRPGAL